MRASDPKMAEALEGLIERLRSNAPLPLCPFDKRSPLYWTMPDDATCHFCGQLPDGPDRCRGADTRVMDQAADALESALRLLGEVEKMRWEPISTAPCDGGTVILGNPEWEGFCTREWSSEASRDDDLSNWDFGPTHWMRPARPTAALDKIRKGMGDRDEDPAPAAS